MRKAFGALVIALIFVFGGVSIAPLSADAAPVAQRKTTKKVAKNGSKKANSTKAGTNAKSKRTKKGRGKHATKGAKKK